MRPSENRFPGFQTAFVCLSARPELLETAALHLQTVGVQARGQTLIAQGVCQGDGQPVGGIGLLTVSRMTRTALGHTGRQLYPAPKLMPTAFCLMVGALFFRTLAAAMLTVHPTAYLHSLRCSGVLFAASLLLYAWRYIPWLTRPRLDGKPG